MSCVNIATFLTGDLSEVWDTTSGVSIVTSLIRYAGGRTLKLGPYQAGNSGLGVGIGGLSAGAFALASVPTSYVRFYWYCDTLTADSICEFTYGAGNTRKARVFASGGSWKIADSAGTTTAAATGPSAATWYRVEVKVGTGTAAPLELRINGIVVATTATANLTASNTGRVALGQPSAAATMASFYYTDFCWDDAAYPGDGYAALLTPTAAGSRTQWTGSYADVANVPPSSGTHIESTGNAGEAATFGLKDTGAAAGTAVNGVKHYMTSLWAASGPPTIAGLVVSGASSAQGPDVYPDMSSWTVSQWLIPTAPGGAGAWTSTILDGAEAGVITSGGGGPPAWVGDLYLLVDLAGTPPVAPTARIGTHTTDALRLKATAKTQKADARLRATPTRSHATDVRPEGPVTRSHGTSTVAVGPLVGWWKLDETAGTTAADSSPVANTGSLGGGATWSTDAAPIPNNPRSLALNGVSASVNTTTTPPIAQSVNSGGVFAWMKTTDAGAGHRGIVVNQYAYGLFLYSNVVTAYDWSTGANNLSGRNVADGTWHHVGFTFQSGVASGTTFYVDGTRLGSLTYNVTTQGYGIAIGAGNNPGSLQFFAGNIDDARVYRTVLSDDQVQSLARGNDPLTTGRATQLHVTDSWLQGRPALTHTADGARSAAPTRSHGTDVIFVGDLTGWWKFNESTPGVAYDATPYANHADETGTGRSIDFSPAPGSTSSGQFATNASAVTRANLVLGTAFTVSCWVKPSIVPQVGYVRIVETDYTDSFYLGVDASGTQYLAIIGGVFGPAAGALAIGRWTHLVLRYGGITATLSVDGKQVAAFTAGFAPPPHPLWFGTWHGNNYNWVGGIDDVRVYAGALSDDQIQSLAYGSEPSAVTPTARPHQADGMTWAVRSRAHGADCMTCVPLVGWWTLDDAGSAQYMADSSLVAAHAYPTVGVTSQDAPAPVLGSANSRYFPGNAMLDAGVVPAHSLTDNFTVSIWINGGSYTGYGSFLTHESSGTQVGWGLVTSPVSVPSFIAFYGAGYEWLDVDTTPTVNTWHNLIGLVRNGARYIYLDGIRQSRVGTMLPSPAPGSHTVLGRFYDDVYGYYWTGLLDDARIYNIPLSDDQLSSLAHGSDPLTVAITTQAHVTDTLRRWTVSGATVEITLYTTQVPAAAGNAGYPVWVGTRFSVDVDSGSVVGVRFWRAPEMAAQTISVALWDDATQALLAQAPGAAGTGTGWEIVRFSQPVPIVAGNVYTVAYFSASGYFSYTTSGWVDAPKDNNPLHASRTTGIGNGAYIYSTPAAYPSGASNGNDYFADPLLSFSRGSHYTGTMLRRTAVVRGGVTLYTTQTPTSESVQSPLEMGTGFSVDVDGYIVGVRFWRSPNMAGIAVPVTLWDVATQAILARATSDAGSAIGWVIVPFSQPVAVVAAGTGYIVSYHTPAAFPYASFGAQRDNPPLHASTANGIYSYGSLGVFPTTVGGYDYFADPIFSRITGTHSTDLFTRIGLVGTRARTGRVGTRTPAFGG